MAARRGRPPFADTPGKRLQVHLPPKVEAALRKMGDGSLSLGIIRAAEAVIGKG